MGFGVLPGRRGEPSRIVVSSRHMVWFPHQIAILDSSGKLTSEYWHSGHLNYFALADLDDDGRQEILAAGISNGYRQATLVVLDPDRVSGASIEETSPKLQIHGTGVAQERIRLLFPRSDVNMASAIFNQGSGVAVENGKVRFSTLECQDAWCPIVYEFDKQFRLLSAYADDNFRGFHNRFYRNDKHPHVFTAEEGKEFQKVRCLVGCNTGFVTLALVDK
jgi:hypothetical protein